MTTRGNRFREARHAMGSTREQAGAVAALSKVSIWRWETSEQIPSSLFVMGLAYLYGRSLAWLYDDDFKHESPRLDDPATERVRVLASVLRSTAVAEGITLDALFGVAGGPSVRVFKRSVRRAGLGSLRSHDLRHTHASPMLSEEVHLKLVSERTGHSSIAITGDIYFHVQPTVQREAVARFGAAWRTGIVNGMAN